MLQAGRMYEIADELIRNRIDMCALQEIRWQGIGEIKKKEYSIYYCGTKEKTGLYGTGFYINKKSPR